MQNNTTAGNTGVVNAASIAISGTTTTTPTISANTIYNAVTMQTGPIAPGEILAIGGSNLGPATAVAAPSGNLPTTLGGVQVTINSSLAAPILYASSTLIVAILPYNAAGSGAAIGGTVTLRVTNNSVPSNTVTTGVAYSSPGLFTVSMADTGKIGVKAINPDGTLNSADNPVAPGERNPLCNRTRTSDSNVHRGTGCSHRHVVPYRNANLRQRRWPVCDCTFLRTCARNSGHISGKYPDSGERPVRSATDPALEPGRHIAERFANFHQVVEFQEPSSKPQA